MTDFRRPAFLVAFVFLLLSQTGPLKAAPDDTLGMALMSAVVYSDGTLIRGSGAVSVGKEGTGFYRVYFDRTINNCTGVAGPGNKPFTVYDGGQAAVNFTDTIPTTVVVKTRDNNGAIADWPFHLIVFCPN